MAHSVSAASSSFNLTFFSFFIITTLLLLRPCNTVAYADANDTRETPPPPPPPPPPGSDSVEKPSSAFKPGMAVVVGVLTTMFSLTFLLLLYIKHCNGATADASGAGGTAYQTSRAAASFAGRKNSGIDRSIVESLPIFRFGSLRGQKDGLDCAVCLAKFESSEVLRLLPKCKHAFHVECVDTWLDAHSTCPLCRHRVDPEDILLVEDTKVVVPVHQNNENECSERSSFVLETRRVSGRHSSVGEKEGGFLEIILENERERENAWSFRRSLDSATCATTSRSRNKKEGGVMSAGWLVRPRKDGMLLVTQEAEREREKERRSTSTERRLEHRIVVSPTTGKQCGNGNGNGNGGVFQRWSDVQPSDLLYLTSEMIISSTRGGRNNRNNNNNNNSNFNNDGELGDSWVINTRSVSEITGLSRFVRNGVRRNREGEQQREGEGEGEREREEGVVSRWLAWISRTQTQPAVR